MGERVPKSDGFLVLEIDAWTQGDLDGQMSDASQFLCRAFGSKRKINPPASRFPTAQQALPPYFSVAMGELVSSEHMDEIEEMMVAKTILVGRFSEKHQCHQRPAMDLSYVDPCVQQFQNLDEITISFLGDFTLKTFGKKQIKNETYNVTM